VKRRNLRWTVVLLIFLATSINYLDRSNLGVAGPLMMKDLHLSKLQFGVLGSAFFWTYTLMQIPVGRIVDIIGPRLTYAIGIVWWSVFSALTAVGRNMGVLIGIRGLMGVGEAPAFPTNTRVISDWLPTHERGFANGLFSMGIAVGAGLTTPGVAWIVQQFGWKASFVVTGALGIIWVFFWLYFFKNKPEATAINKEELLYIKTGQSTNVQQQTSTIRWYQLLKSGNVWVLLYGLFAQDYLLYLMLTWLPIYLVVTKHMTLLKAGFNSVIPWIVASLGALVGGFISDRLTRSGWGPIQARRAVMIIGMILSLSIIPAAFVNSVPAAISLISLALGGMMFANSGSWSIVADMAPAGTAGTLAGMQNFVGNISGWIAPILTGYLADRLHNFVAALVIAGVIGGISALIYLFILKNKTIEQQIAGHHVWHTEVSKGASK
jgi:ACS family D-galactonate transporter-like MFS transporter